MLTFNSNIPKIREVIDGNLREYENDVKDIVLKSALSAEGYAKQLAPVRTDNLRSSIKTRIINKGFTGIVEATAAHAAYVEFNTRPHIIRPKKAKILRFKNRFGEWVFAKQVLHPGTKAQPFMKPALDQEIPYFRRDLQELSARVLQ